MRAASATLVLVMLLGGCSSTPTGAPRAPEYYPQAYYRTGAPLRDISDDLERTLPAVLRVRVRGTYDTYLFEEAGAPTLDELRSGGDGVLARAAEVSVTALTQAGTAVVVAAVERRGTLVTTEHAITLPDTTVVYFGAGDAAPTGTRLLRSISVMKDQENTLVAPAFVESFEILGSSSESDLAVLGVELSRGVEPSDLRAIRLGAGEPRRLSWGSLVYILGHPAGHQMVTRAIVSRPDLGPPRPLSDGRAPERGCERRGRSSPSGVTPKRWSGVGIASAAASRSEYRLEAGGDPDGACAPGRRCCTRGQST